MFFPISTNFVIEKVKFKKILFAIHLYKSFDICGAEFEDRIFKIPLGEVVDKEYKIPLQIRIKGDNQIEFVDIELKEIY